MLFSTASKNPLSNCEFALYFTDKAVAAGFLPSRSGCFEGLAAYYRK